MNSFGENIRRLREQRKLVMRQVAEQLQIDPSLLSRIERGMKRPTRRQVVMLASLFGSNERDLLVDFISDKIVKQIENEPYALMAIRAAEEKIRALPVVTVQTAEQPS